MRDLAGNRSRLRMPRTQTECVSGYYCHLANHITNETHRWRKRPGPIRWQETYHITNETYRMAKETYHMAKETYHMAKETYHMAKET